MLPATLDWLCYALVFSACATLARDHTARGLLVGAMAAGAAWTAVAGVLEYGQTRTRVSATFFDPNFAAGFLALALPVIVAWFCAVRERLGALVLGALAALMLGTLVGTGSRAGIGIGLLGLLVAFALALVSGGPRALPWGRIGALLAAFAVLAFGFRGPVTGRVAGAEGSGGGQEHSGSFRVWTWKGTTAMAKANPALGTGPGTFPFRYPPYAQVAKTELAHSSYLQVAAEQGFPALAAALVAIAVALLAGVASVFRSRRKAADMSASTHMTARVLLCGLIGAVVAGATRSVFDSEWSIFGNGLPFWAVVGMALTPLPPLPGLGEGRPGTPPLPRQRVAHPSAIAPPSPKPGRGGRGVRAAVSLIGLLFSLLLLRNAQTVDAAQAQVRQQQPVAPASVWPPDPNLLYWTGQPEEAARIEPSGRRYFQWARIKERQGDVAGAVPLFKKASEADPNNLQSLRALAEAQERTGDTSGALDSWRKLIRRYEGPAGRIRAIPELPETYPAYAYAAVARAAAAQGDKQQAVAGYEKAAQVIEAYSRTPSVYQQLELASAALNNVDVTVRRQEVRDLYQEVLQAWAALAPMEADTLKSREAETLARLDAFAKPDALGGAAAGTTQ
jgi:O-antigen ligase/tetratricopeptide (TPR) repeat protein